MVHVRLDIHDGCFSSFVVSGHDDTSPGKGSVPCGIVSALARTAARFVERQNSIRWYGEAPGPGQFELILGEVPEPLRERIRGITEFLITGLTDAERDFPEIIRVTVNRI